MVLGTLTLALIGGLISFVSTSLGSLLTVLSRRAQGLRRFRISIDFAIGVMLSATAFSLVGPEMVKAARVGSLAQVQTGVAGLFFGMLFIAVMHKFVHRLQVVPAANSSHMLLALALIAHNLPEGMGAGAAMAGLNLRDALAVQGALSVQNVAEGLLLSVALLSMGWTLPWAVAGGIVSGGVEFFGAALSGIALSTSLQILPFLLTVAGGAMLMSVLLEMQEAALSRRIFKLKHFVLGLASIPFLNLVLLT